MNTHTKMIVVKSRGIVHTSRGLIQSPIVFPYRESIDKIWQMLTQDRADVYEVLRNKEQIQLNVQNYDQDNTPKPAEAVKPVTNITGGVNTSPQTSAGYEHMQLNNNTGINAEQTPTQQGNDQNQGQGNGGGNQSNKNQHNNWKNQNNKDKNGKKHGGQNGGNQQNKSNNNQQQNNATKPTSDAEKTNSVENNQGEATSENTTPDVDSQQQSTETVITTPEAGTETNDKDKKADSAALEVEAEQP